MSGTGQQRLTAELDSHQRWVRHAAQFKLSCMSNTKWRKVFVAIDAAPIRIQRCEFKCIDSDYVTVAGHPPQATELLEGRFTDSRWQPFEYKWLEWFRFPRVVKPHPGVDLEVTQDVETLELVISAAAHACLELKGGYLYLFGFRGGPGAV